jgi:hypothetical protein
MSKWKNPCKKMPKEDATMPSTSVVVDIMLNTGEIVEEAWYRSPENYWEDLSTEYKPEKVIAWRKRAKN